MLSSIFFRSALDLYSFFKIPKNERRIVFYSENKNSYEFFEGLIGELLLNKYTIYYITSDFSDPILKNNRIKSFYIGNGSIRTIFFQFFNSKIMILTMPDLNNTYIKKSKFCDHYIYITHNICSIHMVFRKKAFNNYDTFFCVGPHHKKELKETENLYSINIKKFDFGYYKIDKLLKKKTIRDSKILIVAPSWGKDTILEKYGYELLTELKKLDWKIIIRPHPDTLLQNKKKYNSLKKKFKDINNIEFQENISTMDVFLKASIMISDWSGAAFEFSLGLEKPVIFINVPKKINNSDFYLYKSKPIEDSIRKKIGKIVEVVDINKINNTIIDVFNNRNIFQSKIQEERKKVLYNIGSSSYAGYKLIKEMIHQN